MDFRIESTPPQKRIVVWLIRLAVRQIDKLRGALVWLEGRVIPNSLLTYRGRRFPIIESCSIKDIRSLDDEVIFKAKN